MPKHNHDSGIKTPPKEKKTPPKEKKTPPKTFEYIDLTAAKQQITILNLKFKCLNYRISIDTNTLLLCIFKGDTCISSIEVIPIHSGIRINRNTHKEYQNRKFIKLLTSVIIIIARDLYPQIEYIKSTAINPTSSYLMVKYFKAKAYNDSGEEITPELTEYTDHIEYIKKYERIHTEIEINPENIANAEQMFDIIEKEVKCRRSTTPSKKIENTIVQQNKSIRKIKSTSNITRNTVPNVKRKTIKRTPITKYHSI
jgi:hypothetical protein